MERRRFKYETQSRGMEQYNTVLPQLLTHLPNVKAGPPFSADMALGSQQQHMFPDDFSNTQAYDDTMGLGDNTPGRSGLMNLDWMGMEDGFDPMPPTMLPLQTALPDQI